MRPWSPDLRADAAGGPAGSTILVVDDEPAIVDYLTDELRELGYRIVSAGSGGEGLAQVARQAPDLVLLDLMMPGLDGLSVCRTLKGHDDTRLIPVVMMTAFGALEARVRGIEAGADDFLTKPLDRRELIARIRTALRVKHTVDRKLGDLRRVRDQLAKFVPETVKRVVTGDPDVPELAKQECDVSILFVDVAGYTALSERLPPLPVSELIERYFSAFLDQLQRAGGDITEMAGDGFMAIFRDADPAAHARRSIDTALALLATTAELNEANRETPLAIHMGINSGPALVGSTRFEGARGTRWTFTANGPVTNLAARLAAVAGAGQVLAGPETVRRVGQEYRIRWRGRQRLKNLSDSVDLYQVAGRRAGRGPGRPSGSLRAEAGPERADVDPEARHARDRRDGDDEGARLPALDPRVDEGDAAGHHLARAVEGLAPDVHVEDFGGALVDELALELDLVGATPVHVVGDAEELRLGAAGQRPHDEGGDGDPHPPGRTAGAAGRGWGRGHGPAL